MSNCKNNQLKMDIFLSECLSPEGSGPVGNMVSIETLKEVSKDYQEEIKTDPLTITDLPPEIIQHIFQDLTFDNISKLRMVCKYFNEICSSLLNSEFNQLRTMMLQKFQAIKALMPRRESARRKHPLARESDIIETLNMRLSLLQMTFGKHIERNFCCFFPGEIIDEVYKILRYIKNTPNLNRAYKVTDELFDLSTMAMEYFKEHIEPSLPEISYLAHDLLEQTSFITPGSDLVSQRAQLMQIEYSNMRKDVIQPKKDCIAKFQKQLKSTKNIAKRNRHDIIAIKQALKCAKNRVNNVIKELKKIKYQQLKDKDSILPDFYNFNEILKDLKRKNKVKLKTTSSISCSSNKSNISELFPEKKESILSNTIQPNIENIHNSLSKTSTTITYVPEKSTTDIETIRTLLSKASTTITCIPVDGNNEIMDCPSKVPEKSQQHIS